MHNLSDLYTNNEGGDEDIYGCTDPDALNYNADATAEGVTRTAS